MRAFERYLSLWVALAIVVAGFSLALTFAKLAIVSAAFMLVAAFWASGRRGMLRPR